MTFRYIRIVSSSKADPDYPLYLDAPVDGEGKIVTRGWLFGFFGRAKTDRVHPCIGRLDKDEPSLHFPFLFDFGTDFTEAERYYWSNISNKKIERAAQFAVKMPSEREGRFVEVIYEVRELIDLVNQKPIE